MMSMIRAVDEKSAFPELLVLREKLIKKPCPFSRKKNLMKFTEEQLLH